MEIKSLLKNIGVSVVNSGCDPLKSAVSLKENPDRKKQKKTKKLCKVSSWLFTSIEATENMLFWVMTSEYFWPISLSDFLLLNCGTC